jgi:hypothetical protein
MTSGHVNPFKYLKNKSFGASEMTPKCTAQGGANLYCKPEIMDSSINQILRLPIQLRIGLVIIVVSNAIKTIMEKISALRMPIS